jgi:hypothetical protein
MLHEPLLAWKSLHLQINEFRKLLRKYRITRSSAFVPVYFGSVNLAIAGSFPCMCADNVICLISRSCTWLSVGEISPMLVNGPIILRTSGSTRVDADMIEARWLRLGERQGRRNTSLKYWFIFLGVAVFYMFFTVVINWKYVLAVLGQQQSTTRQMMRWLTLPARMLQVKHCAEVGLISICCTALDEGPEWPMWTAAVITQHLTYHLLGTSEPLLTQDLHCD